VAYLPAGAVHLVPHRHSGSVPHEAETRLTLDRVTREAQPLDVEVAIGTVADPKGRRRSTAGQLSMQSGREERVKATLL
jgi:hypothetical protein